MKKDLKIYLLQVWRANTITAKDFYKIAELAGVNVGVNICVGESPLDALPMIATNVAYTLPREAKVVILNALYAGKFNADTLHAIAKAVGVRLTISINVANEECAGTLHNILKSSY